MVAVVAPLVPAAGEALIALTLLLACIVGVGFLWLYRATLKQILLVVADGFDAVSVGAFGKSVKPFGKVAALFRWTAAEIDHRIAQFVSITEAGVVYFWHALAHIVGRLAAFVGDFAETVELALQSLATVTIPQALLGVERRVAIRLTALRAQVARIEHAGSLALHRAVAVIDGQLGSLRDAAGVLRARLHRVERATVGVGAAALVGAALARIGLGWIRCRNVSRIGKRACSMDTGLLDSLVADTLVVFGAFSLVAFAREMQDVTGAIADEIRTATRSD